MSITDASACESRIVCPSLRVSALRAPNGPFVGLEELARQLGLPEAVGLGITNVLHDLHLLGLPQVQGETANLRTGRKTLTIGCAQCRAHLRDVRAERAMHAGALDTQQDAKVKRRPVR